ncbi:hypothetical protein B0H13DRAFT_1853572 [Mycena leptocephala]|nr:hypothetical protein B0H13DRAFT_1853572 [Mycena leptocephala]
MAIFLIHFPVVWIWPVTRPDIDNIRQCTWRDGGHEKTEPPNLGDLAYQAPVREELDAYNICFCPAQSQGTRLRIIEVDALSQGNRKSPQTCGLTENWWRKRRNGLPGIKKMMFPRVRRRSNGRPLWIICFNYVEF